MPPFGPAVRHLTFARTTGDATKPYRLISLDVNSILLDDFRDVYSHTRWHRAAGNPHPPSPIKGSATHVRSDPIYVRKAQLFRVLGHPVRIRMLELLLDGERSVGELQAALSLDSSSAAQHLAALRQQGVLEATAHHRSQLGPSPLPRFPERSLSPPRFGLRGCWRADQR